MEEGPNLCCTGAAERLQGTWNAPAAFCGRIAKIESVAHSLRHQKDEADQGELRRACQGCIKWRNIRETMEGGEWKGLSSRVLGHPRIRTAANETPKRNAQFST